jgi:hypothetical protein
MPDFRGHKNSGDLGSKTARLAARGGASPVIGRLVTQARKKVQEIVSYMRLPWETRADDASSPRSGECAGGRMVLRFDRPNAFTRHLEVLTHAGYS